MQYTCEEQARYATLNQTFASDKEREDFIKYFIIKCNAKNQTAPAPVATPVTAISTPVLSQELIDGGVKPITGASAIVEPEIVTPIVKPQEATVTGGIKPLPNMTANTPEENKECPKCKSCFWAYVAVAVLGAYILLRKK